HEEAASLAFSFKRPVLLTTGSRNLMPYVKASRKSGIGLVVRVLPYPDSVEACREAGVSDDCVITGRGPFSVEENLEIIRRFSIGAIVTKDSGVAGGVPAKLEAAERTGCKVVVVRRPIETASPEYHHFSELLQEIIAASSVE
ncbi:MAG: precorrin-6A/cobalt-precorrin-6A reductase, partial [Desulfomonile tiedjei]|nr:precorrin-6A/cobalt-precorrin-6A reductase [Desulfomonile tiedjei]